jgi:thioesterase domain-containing protein
LTKAEVEAYLKDHIPLSAAMDIDVVEAGPRGVTLSVPLEPTNVNHRSTAFGGSVAALATLTGWTLVHLRLRDEGIIAQTVIQSSSVQYDAPIHGNFCAISQSVEERAWKRFTRAVTKHGKGRLHVSVNVTADGETAATFTGAYVALDGKKSAGDP